MRSLLLYVFLVGVPGLAIFGVLRVGERLRSPIFVGGIWNVERAGNPGPASSYGYSLINPDRAVLTISQAGSRLWLTLNDENRTTFEGELRDVTITASIARLGSQTSLGASGFTGALIQLHATVERGSESDRLSGTLIFSDSPTAPVTFSAKQQAARPTQGQ
jgi:hypothetical protein